MRSTPIWRVSGSWRISSASTRPITFSAPRRPFATSCRAAQASRNRRGCSGASPSTWRRSRPGRRLSPRVISSFPWSIARWSAKAPLRLPGRGRHRQGLAADRAGADRYGKRGAAGFLLRAGVLCRRAGGGSRPRRAARGRPRLGPLRGSGRKSGEELPRRLRCRPCRGWPGCEAEAPRAPAHELPWLVGGGLRSPRTGLSSHKCHQISLLSAVPAMAPRFGLRHSVAAALDPTRRGPEYPALRIRKTGPSGRSPPGCGTPAPSAAQA